MTPYEIIYQDMFDLFHIEDRGGQYAENISDSSIEAFDYYLKVFKYEHRTEPNTFLVSNREMSCYPDLYRVNENYYLRLFSMSKTDLQNYIDRYKALKAFL
jgi:hypothetical protein